MLRRNCLGQVATLTVARSASPGAFLIDSDSSDGGTILLPRSEVPPGTKDGDRLEVFIYLDSDDRPIATVRAPMLALGEVAFLEAKAIERFGAFFDWGLPKELLVPRAEMTVEPRLGERYAVGLYLDDTGRLAGTMRVAEMLDDEPRFEAGSWVQGEAWRQDPDFGLFVIVERRCVGLIPAREPHELMRGQASSFRVARVLGDGKIELSHRALAHEELERDAKRILDKLRGPRPPRVSDASDPEKIRTLFGMSKKAFKRALGRLLAQRQVQLDSEGFVRVH